MSKGVMISGSVAYDTIMVFDGQFKDHILPEQTHMINVAFLTPRLKREFGGCAANIAYNLQALGGSPVILAAVGRDGADYVERLRGHGIDCSRIVRLDEHYTAQAFITTDLADNQITAFHPGAMSFADQASADAQSGTVAWGIVAPNGRDAMIAHAAAFARQGIPFIFDPGQGLPMFDGAELREFIAQARWVAVNDYEAKMLCDRTGHSLETLSTSHLDGVVVTLGAQGCDIWVQGRKEHVPGIAATEVIDPTGCGDAFRGALLYGLERGWPLRRCVALGNRLGAAKIACRGGQNHQVDPAWTQA